MTLEAEHPHIKKVIHNLNVISQLEAQGSPYRDWQITLCFYSALHLTRYHLQASANYTCTTHEDAKDRLHWQNTMPFSRMDKEPYQAYADLEGFSRRARYIPEISPETFEKDYIRAIQRLDKVMHYFDSKYSLSLPKTQIKCPRLIGTTLHYFTHPEHQ